MDHIKKDLQVTTVQIPFSTPNSNYINPLKITIGRNTNFTEINRLYIKPDLNDIPKNAIVLYSAIKLAVLETDDDDGDNDAFMMGFLVTSKVTNFDYVTWNNMPQFNLYSPFFNQDIHGNSIIMIDVTSYIQNIISGNAENNGFIFINGESSHNEAILDGDNINGIGVTVVVEYYDPDQLYVEKTLDISSNTNSYYTDPILVSYIKDGSIFVKNNGLYPINVAIEISGNGIDFIEDNKITALATNTTKLLIPYSWAKYIRLHFTGSNNIINSNVILQGHYV